MPKPFTRRWIAWKLVQLAYRIKNVEYNQAIVIQPPNGSEIRIEVLADLYGYGIAGTSGIRWNLEDDARNMFAEVNGWNFRWEESDID